MDMNTWKSSIKHHYLKKKVFTVPEYRSITDADYAHARRVCKDLEIKNLAKYYDFYVQSDPLLLADIFGNFRNMFLETYEIDLARFLTVPGLAWQAGLKRTKVKLDLLPDINMLKKVPEEEYVTLFIDIQKLVANT